VHVIDARIVVATIWLSREFVMRARLILSTALVGLAALAAPATAHAEAAYPWCAVSSSGGLGQPLCHFATLEQCTVFLNGLTGSCRPNARAAVTQKQPGKRAAR
jgi:hypothetical protein